MRLTVLKNHVPINEVLVETPDLNEKYEIYVGRSEDCHVLIDDPLISRHHFVLKNENGKWFCEKLSQLGVVSVNGLASGRMEFQDGDEIKCGLYTVVVHDLPTVAKPQQASFEPRPLVYQEQKPLTPAPVPTSEPTPAPSLEVDDDLLSMESLTIEDDFAEDNLDIADLDSLDTNSDEGDSLSLNDLDEGNGGMFDGGGDSGGDSFMELESPSNEDAPTESFNSELEAFSDSNELIAEDSGDEKTSFIKAFVNYQLVLFGERAPYDRYQIDSDEVFIGRDPKKCQIVLDDPEVSTVHAVIKKNLTEITLEDLNSSNGTILNGERINRSTLTTGDEFVIGSTSFTLETRSDLLEAESDRLMPVEKDQSIDLEEYEEEIVDLDEGEVDFGSEAPPEKSLFKRFQKDPAFRKKAIYGIVGLLVLFLFFGDGDQPTPVATDKDPKAKEAAAAKQATAKNLSPEDKEIRNMAYELGVSFFDQNKYREAEEEFKKVISKDENYKKVQTYYEQTKAALAQLAELDNQKRAAEERVKNKKIIEELLVKARDAVKERQVSLAENYLSQIVEKDPENIEVQQLKFEIEAWQKEQEKIALEKATKEASRKAMVDALNPGKTFYLKKEWYRAILKLEEFLLRKGSDEDLVKEASDMLADARTQLATDLGPLIGKARSLKEGQDLKNAYEAYLDVLKVEPTHLEALNEVDEIKNMLETRSKKIYREAIISESLSLFTDAKEKFQEVQQVSPSDSEYYRKASEKLKNYLE